MHLLLAQRSTRPAASAARSARRAPVIEAVAAAVRGAGDRALVPAGQPLFRRLGLDGFAAGAAAAYIAQAIGQMTDDGKAPQASTAAAAYDRADMIAAGRIAAPLPAASLSA